MQYMLVKSGIESEILITGDEFPPSSLDPPFPEMFVESAQPVIKRIKWFGG